MSLSSEIFLKLSPQFNKLWTKYEEARVAVFFNSSVTIKDGFESACCYGNEARGLVLNIPFCCITPTCAIVWDVMYAASTWRQRWPLDLLPQFLPVSAPWLHPSLSTFCPLGGFFQEGLMGAIYPPSFFPLWVAAHCCHLWPTWWDSPLSDAHPSSQGVQSSAACCFLTHPFGDKMCSRARDEWLLRQLAVQGPHTAVPATPLGT